MADEPRAATSQLRLREWHRRMEAAGWALTEEQWEAVQSPHRRVAVYAGPGAGKTTVLSARVLFLLQVVGMRPADLLVTTFTREAAGELKERIRPWLSGRSLLEMEVGTLHSRMLRWWVRECGRVPRLLTPTEQRLLVERIARRKGMATDEAAAALALAKARRPDRNEEWSEFLQLYQRELRRHGAWDFDDILIQAHELLFVQNRIPPWKAILVDEAQDLNELQSALIEGLVRHGSLFMIGDDDQSIYGFRGAVPEYFRGHLYRPDTVAIALSLNHRSHQGIVEAANRLIAHNEHPRAKSIRALRGGPRPEVEPFADEWEQDRWLSTKFARAGVRGTVAVLARTHQQLQRASAPWKRRGGGEVEPIQWLTFHGAKGREFDTVLILDAVEGSTPYLGARGGALGPGLETSDIAEERRLFYVAMTRARQRLILLVPGRMGGRETRVSRFLAEAGLVEQHSADRAWHLFRVILRRL